MIFLDSSSTTPLDPVVLEAMLPYLQATGRESRLLGQAERSGNGQPVREARESVAELLHCLPNEVIWTSGATEANNLAILGFASQCDKPGRIVSQVTEHSAVLEPLRQLNFLGWEVELLPVDEMGRISLSAFADAVEQPTDLVSIMWGNNEIGTLQPVSEIAELCFDRGIVFHCDAAQAIGKIPIDLLACPLSMLTLSAHKFYGPVGAGALFVRDLAKQKLISPLMFGGGQEHSLRPGTLNLPAIIGLGAACQLAREKTSTWSDHTCKLRDKFESSILNDLPSVSINGDAGNRLPHVSNLAFHGTDGEGLLAMLPEIVASTGSACHFADFAPSHVLSALNANTEITECSLRFGFTKNTTHQEVGKAAEMVVQAVNDYRSNC